MRRTLLTLLGGLPLLLLLAGLTFSGAAVESAGQRALAKIEDRIGLPVSADRVFLEGADRAGVERLRVGPADRDSGDASYVTVSATPTNKALLPYAPTRPRASSTRR